MLTSEKLFVVACVVVGAVVTWLVLCAFIRTIRKECEREQQRRERDRDWYKIVVKPRRNAQ